MTGDLSSRCGTALDHFSGKRDIGTIAKPLAKSVEEKFVSDFAALKVKVIRPVFAGIGNLLKDRGHDFNISEEQGGRISIHIVPGGVSRSIHPYDWFPTLSCYCAPFTKTIGLHGRNMRPNAEGNSGSRGNFKAAQIDSDFVEKELMKFIGEIDNW